MFHIKFINKKRVIYSDIIPETEHFFTTRETVIRSHEEGLQRLVRQNKKDIANYLDIDKKFLISPTQTHTDNVRLASKRIKYYPNTDALINDETDIAIYLNFADCTPIVLYDKERNVGAIAHAGWRGTAAQIVQKTAALMQSEYYTKPENLYAVIGPTIAICCYCVGEEVFEQLKSTISDIEPYNRQIYEKIYIDLKGINKQQLIEFGVPKNNIDVCPYCTSCNNDLFFSYRKEYGTTSRHSAVLKLNKQKADI